MLPHAPTDSFCLFLDVDGTLLDIASRPDGVAVSAPLRDALSALAKRMDGAVALVSGRTIADIDQLFAPLRLRASGVHGAEMRFTPDGPVAVAEEYQLSPTAVARLRAIAAQYDGTLVEDKRFSVAVHYRAAPTSGAALQGDLEAFVATPDGQGCRILPGHMVFEVKRAGFDKGVAIREFMSRLPFTGRQPVFLGDDVTDLPGFAQVLTHGGLAYSVTTPRAGTSGHFPDPAAVRAWLAELAAKAGRGSEAPAR